MSHREPVVSVGFVSLGCAKNLVDSEIMAGALLKAGLCLAASPEEADVVVVNTCAFIRAAKDESIQAILDVCAMKETGRCGIVIVAGCLPQRYGRALQEALPEVDAFIGLDELGRLPGVIRQVVGGKRGLLKVSARAGKVIEPRLPRVLFTGGPYAYLKVADGCHHRCRFCAIPRIRGPYRSRKPDAIVREAEHLLANGVKELNLVSQDVLAYGRGLRAKTNLPALLRALGKVGGQFWIRLLYGYPALVSDELLDAMGEVPQVCAYLDLPVQHSHPRILRAMGRTAPAGREAICRLLDRIRARLPGVTLRTTCLVGFPGEREAHFRDLLALVEAAEFEHLGVFVYSPEEGTPAFRLPGRVRAGVAAARRDRLLAAQRKVVDRIAQKRIGQTATVLIESRNSGRTRAVTGRSQREAPEVDGVVLVRHARTAPAVGEFVQVRYEGQRGYDIEGRVC
ncbi:MAG: 30S ribosomal protein S12 methylthiotransferase RimO [Kiritimatiellae bacterium]|nr:30S ribosomal protein S12 methylthiotransferase RimO [Kiritimatiellia bacterium]